MKNKKVLIIVAIVILVIACIICAVIGFAGLAARGGGEAFKNSRDTQRKTDVSQMKEAITQLFKEAEDPSDIQFLSVLPKCDDGSETIGSGGIDLEEVLVPDYMIAIPKDPTKGDSVDTGYTLCIDVTSSSLIISAPNAEGTETIREEVDIVDSLPNPADGISDARNTQRQADANTILNAVSIYLSEGHSISDLGVIPFCNISRAAIGTSGIDLAALLVPEFIVAIPRDPQTGTDTDSGYTICQNNKGQINISAPAAENGVEIEVKR